MSLKMNVLLAQTDNAQTEYNKSLQSHLKMFKNETNLFEGVRKTYTPKGDNPVKENMQGFSRVVFTVDESLISLIDVMKRFWKLQFAEEATNSKGAAKVELKVDGHSFGMLTAYDLMRLKNFLQSKDLRAVLEFIPTRTDTKVWTKSVDDDNKDRSIYEQPISKSVDKTTEKEEVILRDPNLDPAHIPSGYTPRTTIKSRVIELGDSTIQYFSGEWSTEQKNRLIARLNKLQAAVITALKEVNDVETERPNLDVDSTVNFLFDLK